MKKMMKYEEINLKYNEILKLSQDAKKRYDDYVSWITPDMSDTNRNYIIKYGEIYELAYIISDLYNYIQSFDIKETKDLNQIEEKERLDYLLEINKLIFENEYYYKKRILNLVDILAKDSSNIIRKIYSNNYDATRAIMAILTRLGVNTNLFDINITSSDAIYTRRIEDEFIKGEEVKIATVNGYNDYHFHFHLPIPGFPFNYFDRDPDLLTYIKNGWTDTSRSKRKYVYLVNFNTLWGNDEKSNGLQGTGIVYSYIKYNLRFVPFLVYYLERLAVCSIIDYNIDATAFILEDRFKNISNWNKRFSEEWRKYNEDKFKFNKISNEVTTVINHKILNYIQSILMLSSKGPLFTNKLDICNIIQELYSSEIYRVLIRYLEYNSDESINDIRKELLSMRQVNRIRNKNILFNFMFLVDDLNHIKKNITNVNLNGGPQSQRAKCSMLDQRLSIIDHSFRRSLFLQATRHKSGQNVADFSFKNIHMNLGDVRW